MKLKHKLKALAVFFCMAVIGTVWGDGWPTEEIGGLLWEYREIDGCALMHKVKTAAGGNVSGEITVPGTLGGYPVTEIDSGALHADEENDLVTKVVLPEGLTTLEEEALAYCPNLTEVVLPTTLTKIGKSAFKECKKLTTIGALPEGLKEIGASAFVRTPLRELAIPDSVTKVGDGVFGSGQIESVVVGKGVKEIPIQFVSYCTALTNVSFRDGCAITAVGERAFENCPSLKEIAFPQSLKSIDSCAFKDCTNLIAVTFSGEPPSFVSTFPRESFQNVNPSLTFYITDTATGWYEPTYAGYPVKKPSDPSWPPPRTYAINYEHLFGVTNGNATSYTAADLPITLSPVERSGFVFLGWKKNGLGEYVSEIPVGTTGDLYYWANWGVVVTLDANDGAGNKTNLVFEANTRVDIVTPMPTRNGYEFAGWYTEPEGGTLAFWYMDGMTFYKSETYYAHWHESGDPGPGPGPDPQPTGKQTTTLEPWFDYVDLDPVEEEIATDGVKLTGGKECAAGTVLKLNAKAPKVVKARGDEWVFAGWYSEKAYDSALNNGSQDWRLASGYKFTSLAEDVTLFARFVPKSVEAQYLKVECFTLTDEYETGKEISPSISVETTAYTLPTVKVSGLPSGLKFDVKEGKISGTPKKSGVYAATVTATAAGKTTATATVKFIVRQGGERVVDVEYDAAMGKVKGAGIYATGQKVTLKATANKGYVFVGWYASEAAQEPLSQAASYVIDEMPESDVKMYAKFSSAMMDKISISADVNGLGFSPFSFTQQETNVSCGVYLEWPVSSEALTMPTTVKVSGLPSGLKFTAKPVTTKVTSGTGKSKVTTIVTNVPPNTIYGVPAAASKVDKNGTVKPSTVKVTVTSAGKSKQEFVIALTVDPLPVWAVGDFVGNFIGTDIEVAPGVTNHYVGSTTFTVKSNGKISGKAKTNLGDVKFKADSFDYVDADGYYRMTLQGTLSYNRKSMTVPFVAWVQPFLANSNGTFACISETDVEAGKSLDEAEVAFQNPWKIRKDLNYPSFPTGKDALSLPDGELVLDFGKDGVVKFAGKVPGDNETPVSVSGTTQVMPMGWHKKDGQDVNNTALTSSVNVFVAPKKGLENGFFEQYKIDLISDDAKSKFEDVRKYQ